MILDIFRVTVTKSLESVEDLAAYDEYQNRHAVDLVLDYMIRNGAVIEVSLPNMPLLRRFVSWRFLIHELFCIPGGRIWITCPFHRGPSDCRVLSVPPAASTWAIRFLPNLSVAQQNEPVLTEALSTMTYVRHRLCSDPNIDIFAPEGMPLSTVIVELLNGYKWRQPRV